MSDIGISFDATLPLDWEVETSVSASALEQRRYSNISLLKALAAIEAVTQESDDIPVSMRKDMERMESKLDMLLMLVARLAQDATPLPPDHEISLSQGQITWKESSPTLPGAGQALRIRLFLSPRIPQPLVLQVVVVGSMQGEIEADFTSVDDELGEWLTRTIFRYHRRAVHAKANSA